MGQITPTWQATSLNPNANTDSWGNDANGGFGQPGQPLDFGGFHNALTGSGGGNPADAANPGAFGQSGWKPSYSAPGGYNPLQYATDETANELAQGLGGTVERTKTLGPFGDFGQNQIRFDNGNQLNAGLLGDRYTKHDRATADAMTAVERNAKPVVTNPNAGAIFMNGQPMPGSTPPAAVTSPHNTITPTPITAPPTPAPVIPPTNPLIGGPGTEPLLTGLQPGASTVAPSQINSLATLLQFLGMVGQQQPRQQYRQPFGNSRYYPNLPRTGQQMATPTQQTAGSGFTPQMQQQLLSLLLGF